MADIITTANRSTYTTEVRIRLLGSDDSTTLPDATIAALIDFAERQIKSQVTDWATVLIDGGDDKENLIDAAILQLCLVLLTPLRNVIYAKEKLADTSVERDLDFAELKESLKQDLDSALNLISIYEAVTVTICGVIERDPAIFEDLNEY